MAEAFVDPALFAGTCYRAAGWMEIGEVHPLAKCPCLCQYPLVRPPVDPATDWLAEHVPRFAGAHLEKSERR